MTNAGRRNSTRTRVTRAAWGVIDPGTITGSPGNLEVTVGASAFEDNKRLVQGKCNMDLSSSIASAKATIKAGLDATGVMLSVDAGSVSMGICDKVTIDYGEGIFATGVVIGRKGGELIIAGMGGKITDNEIKLCLQVCVSAKVNWKDVGETIKDFFEDIGRKTSEWFDKAAIDTGTWVNNAAKDTENWVNGAAKDTKNWVEGAAKDVSNWFGSVFG